jgi:putative transposase
MAKLSHVILAGHCYFVTTTVSERRPLFNSPENAGILLRVIYNQRKRKRFYLLGFVIMPEHFHLMIVPREGNKLSFIMQEVKKGSARLINQRNSKRGKVWMDEYYESVIRGEEDFGRRLGYMANNPVKRGLVKEAGEYPFSSVSGSYETDLEDFLSGSGTTPNTGETENYVVGLVPEPDGVLSRGQGRPRILEM